jgi:menaquinone-specific isochorismate synthase
MDYEALQRHLASRWKLAKDTPMRYYGGLRFDGGREHRDDRWAAFGTYRFVLPRFELRTDGQTATLACHLVLPRDRESAADVLDALEALAWPNSETTDQLPPSTTRTDAPSRAEWIESVNWALHAIDAERLDKVVLARRSTFDFLRALDPMAILRRVQATTPECFHFAFQPQEGSAFVGASPERLFRQSGRRVRTEAVAGTRSRGDSDQADEALREELLASEKDRREHAYVQDTIQRVLDPLSTRVELNHPPAEMKLARGRHLRSRLEATLRPEVTPLELLKALHPTPAVGGVPSEAARAAIRSQEPFDRGWYAGPVGWIEPEAAEFAVAIRCGLVRGSELDLFSGAGIVDGSVPEREWDEIEQKIGDFAAVLGLSA